MKPVDPNHAPHRVDVKGWGIKSKPCLHGHVDQTNFGTGQHDPSDREQNTWNDQRDDGERVKKPPHGRIRSFIHPSQGCTNHKSHQRSAQSKLHRISQGRDGLYICIRRDVIGQSDGGRRIGSLRRQKTLPNHEAKRHQCQKANHEQTNPNDQPFRIKTEFHRTDGFRRYRALH